MDDRTKRATQVSTSQQTQDASGTSTLLWLLSFAKLDNTRTKAPKANPPAAKRARHAGPEAARQLTAASKRKTSKRGTLQGFMNLPLEVFPEVSLVLPLREFVRVNSVDP